MPLSTSPLIYLSLFPIAMAAPTTYLPPRLIALEERALFPSLQPISAFYNATLSADPSTRSKLQDLGDGRIADMDTGHITTQILSTIPGIASTDPQGCVHANDALAAAIAKYPNRLGGFAALPMAHPSLAVEELKRAVKELGLVGAMIDNHLPNGSYYDSQAYDPVFATAETLGVPIYIHPAPPTDSQIQFYQGNYPPQTALRLAASAWGWHADVGQHLIRFYVSGLFLRHPHLKIVIGHDGETLPMMIDRVDDSQLRSDQTFREVWERNLWIKTSCFFHLRTLEMLLNVTKIERVMFSVDYPLVDIAKGWRFVEEVAGSGILSEREMDMFAFGNAEGLLRLNGTKKGGS